MQPPGRCNVAVVWRPVLLADEIGMDAMKAEAFAQRRLVESDVLEERSSHSRRARLGAHLIAGVMIVMPNGEAAGGSSLSCWRQ